MDLTVVIPAYNEGNGIAAVLGNLMTFLQKEHITAKVIVINDGSTDDTAGAAASVKGVEVISHPYNKGYGAALKTGIRKASTEWVITFDSDGQHTSENLKAILPFLTNDADLVIGKREGYKGPWIRQPGKRLIGAVANYLTEMKIPDYNSGLRA